MFQETSEFPRVCALSYFKGILSPKKGLGGGRKQDNFLKNLETGKANSCLSLDRVLTRAKEMKTICG